MKTALFAGDRASLVASGEQMKDPKLRPDALLTDLSSGGGPDRPDPTEPACLPRKSSTRPSST